MCGTVFELIRTKDGWKHQVLYSFAGGSDDGANPTAGLVFDSVGNLYGATSGGGSGSYGTVFKLARNSQGGWTESILYSFAGYSDGIYPNTGLVFDRQGNLYGTTDGGTGTGFCGGEAWGNGIGCGIVFRLTPNRDGTWTERRSTISEVHPTLRFPSDLYLDADGNLYGASVYGGTGPCILADGEFTT